jgi:vesicle coat complex subunit
MQKTNEIDSKEKEKPCWFYIDSEPLTSYRESQQKMMSKEISDKEEALRTILKSITHDESYPDNLMINVIHNLSIVDDLRIKRMLFLFWEVGVLYL